MAVIFDQYIEKETRLVIWEITENISELHEQTVLFLETGDLEKIISISNEKRKKEILITKILLFNLFQNTCKLHYDNFNKPYLSNNKAISISHSTNLIGILISDKLSAGLDIEKITEKVEIIKNKFLSDGELNSIDKENKHLSYTILWTAKEALYKLYGKKELIFKNNIYIPPFIPKNQDLIDGYIKIAIFSERFNLNYFILNDNIVTWCVK